jgi:hypothetical protein
LPRLFSMRTTIFSTLVLILLSACYTTERNCKPFQTGTFTFYTVVDGDTLTSRFVRNDSIEIDYFAGIADTANVRWVSDCECIVTKRNPLTFQDAKSVQMKILSTFEDGYVFEYSLVGDRSNVQRGRVTNVLD